MAKVFFSYSHADEGLRDQLEIQLAMLKRQGVIETWHDRRIGAGEEIDSAISEHVDQDEIILLLVSPDFLASEYCYEVEMRRALERHERGDAVVIPVILRPCDWHPAPFGRLMATPRDGKPVTQWADRDEALLQVTQAIRAAAERFQGKSAGVAHPVAAGSRSRSATRFPVADQPRSSNLRLAKTFTQKDKDQYQADAFEYIARFFQNSLEELEIRNPGYEGAFQRVDSRRFFATVYRHGEDVARGTVFMGGHPFASGINYMHGQAFESNSFNESLFVQADDQALYLACLGMSLPGEGRKLSMEGAAELFWGMLISPLQNAPG